MAVFEWNVADLALTVPARHTTQQEFDVYLRRGESVSLLALCAARALQWLYYSLTCRSYHSMRVMMYIQE